MFFSKLYKKLIVWAKHRHAPYFLAGVSFAESSFFPIPPDVMLVPMVLAKPVKAWRLALLTTLTSVLGGILGYYIGLLAYKTLAVPLIATFGLETQYQSVVHAFATWGVGLILLAGITPIPYKIFTIAAGVSYMPLLPFVLGSFLGRGLRFFLVAGILKMSGKVIETRVIRYLDKIGWWFILLLIILGMVWQLTGCRLLQQPPAPVEESGGYRRAPAKDVHAVKHKKPEKESVVQKKTESPTQKRASLPPSDSKKLEPHANKQTKTFPKITHTVSQAANRSQKTQGSVETSVETQVKKESAANHAEYKNNWLWPAQGNLISHFDENAENSENKESKGISITGKKGAPIRSVAPGKVIYAGSSLSGYGKLLVIKHEKNILSVYGHNEKLLVKEGQYVQSGQTIAHMGNTETDSVKLYFEIRKEGIPVDPIPYLENKT